MGRSENFPTSHGSKVHGLMSAGSLRQAPGSRNGPFPRSFTLYLCYLPGQHNPHPSIHLLLQEIQSGAVPLYRARGWGEVGWCGDISSGLVVNPMRVFR